MVGVKLEANASDLIPTFVNVLIEFEAAPEKTEGGIIMPDVARNKENIDAYVGKIVALGDNAGIVGEGRDNAFRVGDTVLFRQYAALTVSTKDGKTLKLLKDNDIILILKRGDA